MPAGPPVTIHDHELPPVLNVKRLAEEVANLLQHIPIEEPGSAVGLFGPWGRGKTYLMAQVRKTLEKRPQKNNFFFARFNPWKYQSRHVSTILKL